MNFGKSRLDYYFLNRIDNLEMKTHNFLIVAASNPLSTIGVFWVVLWIDIMIYFTKKKIFFSRKLNRMGVSCVQGLEQWLTDAGESYY